LELVILLIFVPAYWRFADYLEVSTRSYRTALQEAMVFDETWMILERAPESSPPQGLKLA